MTARGDTRQRAYQAACELAEQGASPTVNAIRERLGGKGGQEAILQGYRDWVAETTRRFSMPELPSEIHQPVLALWKSANTLAQARWDTQRQDLENFVDRLKGALASRDESIAALRGENEAVNASLQESQQALTQAASRAASLQRGIEQRQADLVLQEKELEHARDQLREHSAELARTQGLLSEARGSLEDAHQKLADLRGEVSVARSSKEILEQSLNAERRTSEDLRGRLEEASRSGREKDAIIAGSERRVLEAEARVAGVLDLLKQEQQSREADGLSWMQRIEDVRSQLREAKDRETALMGDKRELRGALEDQKALQGRLQEARRLVASLESGISNACGGRSDSGGNEQEWAKLLEQARAFLSSSV